MKKDYLISLGVLVLSVMLVLIVTRDFFLEFAGDNKILGGFIKFFLLASIGDFIALRIKNKKWKIPNYILIKAIVWGLIGIVIVLMFVIFPVGIEALQEKSILPFEGNTFFFALFVSIIMNFTFAPTMMAFHRVTDTYLNLRKDNKSITISESIESINWRQFINFTVFRTIPFFWIPAHTITFLLPEQYWVIFAAVLGIFLGLILGVFTNKEQEIKSS